MQTAPWISLATQDPMGRSQSCPELMERRSSSASAGLSAVQPWSSTGKASVRWVDQVGYYGIVWYTNILFQMSSIYTGIFQVWNAEWTAFYTHSVKASSLPQWDLYLSILTTLWFTNGLQMTSMLSLPLTLKPNLLRGYRRHLGDSL